jgi:hypothetical protein
LSDQIASPSAGLTPHDRPILIFAQHRGGGTLLTRLLNCHPDVVIWGEHGGLINHLADADAVAQCYTDLLAPRTDAEFDRYLARGTTPPETYDPWFSPLTARDYPDLCRAAIRTLFTRRLRPNQRWGFKEIRYHRPLVARFLARLCPGARIILLTRDAVDLCVSNIMVAWSQDSLRAMAPSYDLVDALRVVEDCLYAIVAMQTNMATIARDLPEQALAVEYGSLAASGGAELARVLGFLELSATPSVDATMAAAAAMVAGATDQPAPDPKWLLTARLVRPMATDLLGRVRADIAANGIDTVRLRRMASQGNDARGTPGRYSFLLGDPRFIEPGISALF